MSDGIEIRAATAADRDRVAGLLRESRGATTVVSRGRVHDAARLPALVALGRDRDELHDELELELVLDPPASGRGAQEAPEAPPVP